MNINRRNLLLASIVLITLVFIFFIWQSLQFRIVSTTPDLSGATPSGATTIELTFNKNLADLQKSQTSVELIGGVVKSVSAKDTVLKIDVNSLDKDKKYTLRLINVVSEAGDVFGQDISFTTKYIPYNKLSNSEKEQQIKSISSDPANELDRKALAVMPYETDDYIIEYTLSTDSQKGEIKITAQLSNFDYENGDVAALTTQRQQAAQTYLTGKGIDLSQYQVTLR